MTAALLRSNGKHINPCTTVLNGRKKKWPRVTAPGQLLEKDETVTQRPSSSERLAAGVLISI